MKSVSVLLPTYRRPDDLRVCLHALLTQTRRPDEIVVGRRITDQASGLVIGEFIKLAAASNTGHHSCRVMEAVVPADGNLLASMNAGLIKTTGDLVILTDDDAEAPVDWVERFFAYFDDPTVGGVGGRDNQRSNPGEQRDVGRLQWFGRIVGNHHLGVGPARSVDVLKGVNCCFRGPLLRKIGFDTRLRGLGNVSNWELAICFAVKRQGYDLIYDPDLCIVHHVAPRHDGDDNNRGGFNAIGLQNAVHNETLAVLDHLPMLRKLAFAMWAGLVGTGDSPGMFQVMRQTAKGHRIVRVMQRFHRAQVGRMAAVQTYLVSIFIDKGTRHR